VLNVAGSDSPRVPSSKEDGAHPNTKAKIRCFDQITEESVDWLWHKRLPVGKSCELIGDPNTGKSFLCTEIIARLSRGEDLPDDEVTKRDAIK